MSDIDQIPQGATVDSAATPNLEPAQAQKPEAADGSQPDDAAKAEEAKKEESAKKERARNRTAQHIASNHRRIAEQAAEIERLKASVGPKALDPEGPQPSDFGGDWDAYLAAIVEHRIEKREAALREVEARVTEERQVLTYGEKVAEFAEKAPDFHELVLAIPPEFLPDQLQKAILAHERGPEIAYHIAQNDDDLFQLASIRPELMGAAVERLVKRLAAPQTKAPALKPISNAPPPPATLSGSAASDVPDEKLTDDQWYRREQERDAAKRRG
ncbi:MAG: hypothetical protein ACRCYS_11385 [Beijerinckiaceae bacterium]